ncbi:gas vesicle protein [Streptosporangium roseum]|uniref:gas vesicle protein n=1 Tax=Streptosporangium roseum TaxID=2001 RepID=UPI0004CD5E0D|nr:gas vesicle protein [Streptosporangium roseum]
MAAERSRGAALAAEGRLPPERVALVDLLDRLLAGGVVVTGDLVLSIADIDLVRISLRVLITSVNESFTTERKNGHEKNGYEPVWK